MVSFIKPGQYEEVNPLSMMLYGQSGAGKTVLAASSAFVDTLQPVLYIDCATSADSFINNPDYQGIDVFRPQSIQDVNKLYASFKKGFNYKTIIFDEIDRLHEVALWYVQPKNQPKSGQKEPHELHQKDYGDARQIIKKILYHFKALQTHFIIISLARQKAHPIDEREMFLPAIAGLLAEEVPADVSMYGFLEARGSKRVLHFESSRRFGSKIRGLERATRFGSSLENPTMQMIYNLYYNIGE